MGRVKPNIWSWVFVVFPAVSVFMILLSVQPVSAVYYGNNLANADAYSTMELNAILEAYQTEAKVLDSQIKETQKDIDWLTLKINRIQDGGKKASLDLVKSVETKEQKVKRLVKEKTRLNAVSAMYLKEINSRTKQGSGKSLAAKPAKTRTAKSSPRITSKSIVESSNTIKKSSIEAAVKKAGLDDWVEVNGDDTCIRIETTLPILFSSGSAKVAKEYQSFFRQLALFLKPYDVKVLVNGYADTVPINTKQYPSNFELGATRAANIIHELVRQGLKPSIFKIETTGEYRFAAKEPSKQKSFERRAQVTVIFTG